ncbi:MAG: hypothetical protein Q8O67_33250 [Deltaproteobacteria bacterium]|nr:hypothetical protein [Deltaproteobacteria bacterium]
MLRIVGWISALMLWPLSLSVLSEQKLLSGSAGAWSMAFATALICQRLVARYDRLFPNEDDERSLLAKWIDRGLWLLAAQPSVALGLVFASALLSVGGIAGARAIESVSSVAVPTAFAFAFCWLIAAPVALMGGIQPSLSAIPRSGIFVLLSVIALIAAIVLSSTGPFG